MGPKRVKNKGKGRQPAPTVNKEPDQDMIQQGEIEEEGDHRVDPDEHSDGAEEPIEAGPTKKSKTRPVQTTSVSELLTEEQESELAEWFCQHPIFWDKTRKDFKQAEKKERLLDEKAKTYVGLDLVGKNIRTWFTTQRSNYGRWRSCKSMKSGSGKTHVTSRNKWVLANFSWLDGHVVLRTQTSQLGVIGSTPTVDDSDKSSDNSAVDLGTTVSVVPTQPLASTSKTAAGKTSNNSKTVRSRRDEVDETLLQLVRHHVDRRDDAATPHPTPVDTIGAYISWLEAECRQLPERQWSNFQRTSMQWIMDARDSNPSPASRSMPSHTSNPTYPVRRASAPPDNSYGSQDPLQPIIFHTQLPGYQRQLQPQATPVQQLGEFGTGPTRQYPFTAAAQPLSVPGPGQLSISTCGLDMSGIIPSSLQTSSLEYIVDNNAQLNPDNMDNDNQ